MPVNPPAARREHARRRTHQLAASTAVRRVWESTGASGDGDSHRRESSDHSRARRPSSVWKWDERARALCDPRQPAAGGEHRLGGARDGQFLACPTCAWCGRATAGRRNEPGRTSSGAHWPLDDARVFERLEDAVADLTQVFATTARPREAALPVITPREAAAAAVGADGGRRRYGPAVRRRTLRLAGRRHRPMPRHRDRAGGRPLPLPQPGSSGRDQRLRMAADAGRRPGEDLPRSTAPAEQAEVIGFHQQLEAELDAAGFFHPPEKRPSMVRNLRVMFGRAGCRLRRCGRCGRGDGVVQGAGSRTGEDGGRH